MTFSRWDDEKTIGTSISPMLILARHVDDARGKGRLKTMIGGSNTVQYHGIKIYV